ncbi:carbohydrate kinase family protein [Patescibacteria group bacterium]|nr:carbohydrate kinase family protein [Patescibacteria group bacterium]MBU0801114.1 carbohydrate kinase family protein [Alphaproteobacteria bacterium]MBU1755066.1 carbohydrate kinase family protein [Patescibacteria group bacterium]
MTTDFFAIGDIVTEPFIKLLDAHVNCSIKTDTCEICMRFGDKIPYESATHVVGVGNAPNAAVAAARLGLPTGIRTHVGDDRYGVECIEVLKKEGIDTQHVVTEQGKITNYHFVLSYESERTILVKHEEFEYAMPDTLEPPAWIYLSSLASNSLPYHKEIEAYLSKNPSVKFAFQPGTFQMELGYEALKNLYERSDLFFCNKEEAMRILGITESTEIPALLELMRERGPKTVVITDGRNGAYAYDGAKKLFVPMYPDTRPPVERTGAGDAFSSTVASALALGHPLEEALRWGPINSMSVVQEIGAQKGLLTREQLLVYLHEAPESYKVSEV